MAIVKIIMFKKQRISVGKDVETLQLWWECKNGATAVESSLIVPQNIDQRVIL